MTSPQGPAQTPAGWYPDPGGSGRQRYWDGAQWTEHYSGGGAGAPAYAGGQVASRTPAGPAPQLWWGVPAVALLLLVGCIGTWIKAEVEIFGESQSTSEGGLDKDGSIVLVITIIAVVLLVLWRAQRARWQAIAAAALGALAVIICVADVIDVGNRQDTSIGTVSVGWGLWLSLIGSIALTILSILLALQSRRAP